MSDFPFYLLSFLLVITVLVFFHELGHYLVARACGVKVLRFSIGFGPVLWKKVVSQDATEWVVSLVPLGGYVKMLDEREGAVAAEELPRAFNRQSVGKRSLIVAAGPFANLLLAVLLYWGVFIYGSNELLPILGTPPGDTPAANVALRNGQQVRAIDREPVKTWSDFRWLLLQKAVDQDSVELELIDEGRRIEFVHLPLSSVREQGWNGDALERLGVRFFRPDIPPVVGKLVPGGAAALAELRVGDRFLAIEGQAVSTWPQVVEAIRNSPGKSLQFTLERQGEIFAVDVIPEAFSERGQRIGKIGVGVAESPDLQRNLKVFVSYDPFVAFGKALVETWDKSVFSLVMMGKMLIGEASWRNISGPVTIADYAGQSARLGIDYYLRFMALVSISLGVLNLLPVPVLDGGHLMYHVIEVVRRRPLSERAMEIGQYLGISMLFALMAFAFFNDLSRLFNG